MFNSKSATAIQQGTLRTLMNKHKWNWKWNF